MGFSGKNTGGGCHFLLQGIFLTQTRVSYVSCIADRFLTCWAINYINYISFHKNKPTFASKKDSRIKCAESSIDSKRDLIISTLFNLSTIICFIRFWKNDSPLKFLWCLLPLKFALILYSTILKFIPKKIFHLKTLEVSEKKKKGPISRPLLISLGIFWSWWDLLSLMSFS